MKKTLLLALTAVALTVTACKKEAFNPHNYTPAVGHTVQIVQLAWGLPTSIGGTSYNSKGQQVIVHFYPNKRATVTYVDGKIDKIDWQPK